ncbi:pyridoxal phosphate phosphatase PHOSPHO2-like [Lethenteron reissneri]|uniref:pyridoxal phosphate phosphatase PHOSPHO2-like n=1 Tax=Lethenteron reissneri TaxID=7753 RepID=UPI002AB67A5E|nr:pyridoxal phosphate phosphatase PHOSPHO2-like [Lethenteron reissneri]
MKSLVAFDFDHTLIDDNSDMWVLRCAPGGELPERLDYRGDDDGVGGGVGGTWTDHMNRVLRYLGEEVGVTAAEMRATIEAVPDTPGMPQLLRFLADHPEQFECVIVSDANSAFIGWVLESRGCRPLFRELLTNPASVDAGGSLVLLPFHGGGGGRQHGCSRCPANMCKRAALRSFVERHGGYGRVIYVGDGGNDVCPALALLPGDVVLPRRGYQLERALAALEQAQPGAVQATVVPWESGDEILEHVRALAQGAAL